MTFTVEGAGVPLAVSEHGEGPPVLVIHDIGRPPRTEGLSGRVIAYERRGYGASGAPEPYAATTVHEQAEDAAAVLRQTAGEPARLVGHGFGALIALDVATRHRGLTAGLHLVDPPLFAFVAQATEALAAQRAALEEALHAGGPQAAIDAYLGTESAWARAAHRAVFADLAGLTSWPVTRGALRALALPAVVETSPGAPAHVTAAADAVAGLLPAAERRAAPA